MPRKPVDHVQEMRVSLGQKEREMVEGALAAFQFHQVATPMVAAISDVSFWITLATLLAFFGINVTNPGDDDVRSWTEAVQLGVSDWRAARQTEGLSDDLSVLWRFFTVPGVIYTAGGVAN